MAGGTHYVRIEEGLKEIEDDTVELKEAKTVNLAVLAVIKLSNF